MRSKGSTREIFDVIFLFFGWLTSHEYESQIEIHLIQYFQQVTFDLKLISGQANMQLT